MFIEYRNVAGFLITSAAMVALNLGNVVEIGSVELPFLSKTILELAN
jgi:hypothetical protein